MNRRSICKILDSECYFSQSNRQLFRLKMNFYGLSSWFLVLPGLGDFCRVFGSSELRSASSSHASPLHHLFLDGAHLLEASDVANSAVLQACLLLRAETVVTEARDTVHEAVFDHGELHLHLSLHLHLLHQLLIHLS